VSADLPLKRLNAERSLSTRPCTWNHLESLTESLSSATTVILVAFSAWRSPRHLVQAVKALGSSGCELHLVLAESLMNSRYMEGPLQDLERDVVSIVQVSEGTAMEDRLSGCLESMAAVLSGNCREHLHGRLIWQGSGRHPKSSQCLDEVFSNSASILAPTLLTARLENGMTDIFLDELHRRGFGGFPVATAQRPRGVRVGVFLRHQEVGYA